MALIETKLIKVRNGAAAIRPATPEDAERLEVLNQALDRETEFLMRSPGELTLTLEEHPQLIVKTRNSKRSLLLVAELNGSMSACYCSPEATSHVSNTRVTSP